MNARPPRPADATSPPPALAAFLRGVERRGAVLAELQCGDPIAGDTALAAAMRAFRAGAVAQPMAEWPVRFWTFLLSSPQVRHAEDDARWAPDLAGLGRLGPGPRAALLLRLAAGLDEQDAAGVLGVAPATYRLALRRALPRHADGRADLAAWGTLRSGVHRRIKTLPAERLAHLARLREDALAGGPATAPRQTTTDRPGLVRTLWLLFALCVLALAGTWLWPAWQARGGVEGIQESRLHEEAAAARFGDGFAQVTHRDFDLLADPDGLQVADDLAFHSWLATQPDLAPENGGGMAAADAGAPRPPGTGATAAMPAPPATATGEMTDEPR